MKNHNLFLIIFLFILVGISCHSKENAIKTGLVNSPNTAQGKIIILAIDGGGIKGIIPAIFLDSIESRTKKQSFELFDIIGGTSTGGIIALGLTTFNTLHKPMMPYTAHELLNIYTKDGPELFVKQKCVDHCAQYYASHEGKGIEPYLQKKFSPTRSLSEAALQMSQLKNNKTKQVFTTTYIINSSDLTVKNPIDGKDYGPYLFNWVDAQEDPKHDYFVWEAARGTSAAPTYFPIGLVGGSNRSAKEKWVIDGGMMSNDPAVWAVSEAFERHLATSMEDIIVISLGTGFYPGDGGVGINNNHTIIDGIPRDGNWNYFPWVMSAMYNLEGHKNSRGTILNIVLDAVQEAADRQLQVFKKAGLKYYRLEPTLTASQSKMDNISDENINSLIETANSYLAGTEGKSKLDSIIIELTTSVQ